MVRAETKAKKLESEANEYEKPEDEIVESELLKSDKHPCSKLESDMLKSQPQDSEMTESEVLSPELIKYEIQKSEILKTEALKYEQIKSEALKSVIVKSQAPEADSETLESDSITQKQDSTEDEPWDKPSKSGYKVFDSTEISSPLLSMLGYIPEKSNSCTPSYLNKEFQSSRKFLTEEEEKDITQAANILDMLNAKAEVKKMEEEEKLKKKIDESKVPHRQMRSK